MEIIITRLEMTWSDAVKYVRGRSGYLPSIEMCEKFQFTSFSWTCNTVDDDTKMAYTTEVKDGKFISTHKHNKRLVIMCKEQWTEQILSYREGDIKGVSRNINKPEPMDEPKPVPSIIDNKITQDIYNEIQRKYVPFVYKQYMLAAEYDIPIAKITNICMRRKPYICNQCGLDKNGSEIHTLTHHTFPGCTVEEAVEELWPNYKQYE